METNHLLEKALDVESLRRKVISNNISNVDIPHFKRSEVNFESELRRAVSEREQADKKLPVLMTDKKHIPFFLSRDIQGVRPRVNLDFATTMRNDGNNVDIEKEMVDAAKNLMRYNSFIASLNHNYKMIKMAMKPS
ncbi:MAG: flagellar basal body rod protein FlgB [bacterium]|nr:flagellar basal body rod protein FlgB [bacterium]